MQAEAIDVQRPGAPDRWVSDSEKYSAVPTGNDSLNQIISAASGSAATPHHTAPLNRPCLNAIHATTTDDAARNTKPSFLVNAAHPPNSPARASVRTVRAVVPPVARAAAQDHE
jgi:hypothetical protein